MSSTIFEVQIFDLMRVWPLLVMWGCFAAAIEIIAHNLRGEL